MKAALYLRVSTAKQNTDRQLTELHDYALRHGFEVVYTACETVSGTRHRYQRPGMEKVLEMAREGEITEVVCLELSRLGRDAMDVRNLILELAGYGVCTHVVNKNLRSLDKRRRKDHVTMMILGILADLAEMERETTVERIVSGQQEAKRQGKHIARPKGSTKSTERFLEENRGVVSYLEEGRCSIREIATLCSVSPNTVMKVKRANSATSARVPQEISA
ncbi:recombinase family protein [Rufibacter latericius]|uniref:Recombinase family protein n=1 Tax=Rufibacter latericius TaxID=2487040 RepID=A0A3M9MTJ3_9BACT|nr:recombinase family protein [Rufibacter latericius]RNI28842.1 recombinase family protein [Rufibacter latericius]